MELLSCINCCHNPLQADTLGTSFGYCTEHRVVLRHPGELTCGRQLRRDLPILRADQVRDAQQKSFHGASVQFLRPSDKTPKQAGFVGTESSAGQLDSVVEIVSQYGDLDTKIESLAELRQVPGVRSEIALLSLGRAYSNRCFVRDHSWSSGIHLIWWTRKRLDEEPEVRAGDIRVELSLSLERQVDMAKWFVLMMRLLLISDVGFYAKQNSQRRLSALAGMAERAAEETDRLSPAVLLRWIRRTGIEIFDRALSEASYRRIRRGVREARESE